MLNVSRRAKPVNRANAGKESKTHWIIIVSWIVILGWMIFLIWYWRSGSLHSSTNPTLRLVDSVLTNTETSLRGSLQNIHLTVPIAHIAGDTELKPDHHPQAVVPKEKAEVHVIFSTDCTPYQDWQSLLLFHSATVVGQKGPITRIASGCDEDKKTELKNLYAKLYPQYHVHLTPDFKKDEQSQKSYDFYNKPRGLQHWLKYADPPVDDDIVVALLDPDMIFVRPLTTRVRGEPNILHGKYIKDEELMVKIGKGLPASQQYGLGAPWTNDNHAKFNRGKICGEGSPCLIPNEVFGGRHYSVGPPYMVHRSDMQRIADRWTEFVPRVYAGYPYLLAEMYAYSMAAAHEELPHLQLDNYMVSNVDAGGEGWPLVDQLQNACEPPVNGIYFPGQPLPNVVHYCQNFRASTIGFAKRQANRAMFSCDAPLFLEPPSDLDKATYRIHKNKKEEQSNRLVKRNAYALCVIHRSLNAALIDYKNRMCNPATQFVNYNKTYNVLPMG